MKRYNKKAKYAPNGIDIDIYKPYKRDLKIRKIRILIEGDSYSHYKNVTKVLELLKILIKQNLKYGI